MKTLSVALLALAVVLFAPASAARTITTLPLRGPYPALVAGPGSRVTIVGTTDADDAELVALEWDIEARVARRRASLGRQRFNDAVVAAASGEGLMIVTSGASPADEGPVELVEWDRSARAVRRETVGVGSRASLVVLDRFVVVSFYETRGSAVHVVALERTAAGLAIGGSRVVRGVAPSVAKGRGLVALPQDEIALALPEPGGLRVARLRLPSLAIVQSRVFDSTAHAGLFRASRGFFLVHDAGVTNLSPTLASLSPPFGAGTSVAALDDATGRVAIDGERDRRRNVTSLETASFDAIDMLWTQKRLVAVGSYAEEGDRRPPPRTVVVTMP